MVGKMTIPNWFNSEWYKRKCPDVAQNSYYGASPERLFEHFQYSGAYEMLGVNPSRPVLKVPAREGEFCSRNYLKKNPDVAGDSYFKDKPYEHYIKSGFAEGREHCPEVVSQVPVLSILGQSFMSIKRLSNGQILVGCYSFPWKTSKLYCVGYNDPIAEVYTGEAIFRISEIDGYVYLVCEKQIIYRDKLKSDPTTYKFGEFDKLKAGVHQGAYDLQKLLGKLVGVGGGEIKTYNHGSFIWDDRYYVKQCFEFMNKAYVLGWNEDTQRGGWFVSDDAVNWSWKNIFPKYSRPMAVFPDSNTGTRLWIVGTDNFQDSKNIGHNEDAAAIWMYDPVVGLVHLGTFPGYKYSSAVYHPAGSGYVYSLLTRGWKEDLPGCQLVRMGADGFKMKGYFEEAEGRGLEYDGQYLYCATRTNLKGGKIYQVEDLDLSL